MSIIKQIEAGVLMGVVIFGVMFLISAVPLFFVCLRETLRERSVWKKSDRQMKEYWKKKQ